MKPQQDRSKASAANVENVQPKTPPKPPPRPKRKRWVLLLVLLALAGAAWFWRGLWLPKVPGYQPPVREVPGSTPLLPTDLALMVQGAQLSECVRSTLQAKVKDKVLTHSDLRSTRSQCQRQERKEAQDNVRQQQAQALDGTLPVVETTPAKK